MLCPTPTESNSRWFPTIDSPNQKSTQEMFITVKEESKTLSNGTLIYSKSNSDHTRTDYWKMDKPHAPYLFMLAAGDFAIVEDEWNGMKVDYYVEPEYEEYAGDIFGHTPEMISYFSEVLNYPFPWDKYSQIVVRDFVSGAMENTTASVFMEDLNVDSRELIDFDWDDIIAHELFHQWFGNLVTCESWANVPLNESFATYGEYLWKNHKYGADEAGYHLYSELDTYLSEAVTKNEDVIRFDFDNDDEMFEVSTLLPVELLYFDAFPSNNQYAQLEWATATEINNDGFEVLRSTNGIDFEYIAWISGNGNQTSTHKYSYEDYSIETGITYYYRLKQIDYDGQYEYFNIESVKLSGPLDKEYSEILSVKYYSYLGKKFDVKPNLKSYIKCTSYSEGIVCEKINVK